MADWNEEKDCGREVNEDANLRQSKSNPNGNRVCENSRQIALDMHFAEPGVNWNPAQFPSRDMDPQKGIRDSEQHKHKPI